MIFQALDSYKDALRQWVPLVTVHLFIRLVVLAAVLPVIGAVLAFTISFSDQSALTDTDIARFLLTPVGAVGALFVAALLLAVAVIDVATMTAVLRAKSAGVAAPLGVAFRFVFEAMPRLVAFAGRLIIRVLVLAVPFLAVGGGAAFFLLGEYDINFYLATRPPEFTTALAIGGACLFVLAVVLLERLTAWALAMHLTVFDLEDGKSCFASSRAAMTGYRLDLMKRLLGWIIIRFAAGGLILSVSGFLLAEGPQLFTENLAVFFVVTTLLLLLWAVLNTFLNAIANGALADLLNDEFDRSLSGRPAKADVAVPQALSRYLLVPLLIGATAFGALLLTGYLSNQAGGVEDVQIIAHRGASGSRPENTMAAVEKAIEDGADWVEIDVQETADGEVLVVHDSDFMKAAGDPVKVWDVTMDRVADIDIGSWYDPAYSDERAPLLRDVLETIQDRSKLLIELKYYGHDVALEERVAALVEETGMVDQIATMSLKYPAVQKMRALRPDWRAGVLAATAVGNLARLDGDFIAVSSARVSAGMISHAEAEGKDVYVWTVNDAATMSRMISLGVHGLITDEPALAGEVIGYYKSLSTPERLVLRLGDTVGRAFDLTPEEGSEI